MRFAPTRSILFSSCVVAIVLLTGCGEPETAPQTGIAGEWSTPDGAQMTIQLQLVLAGSSLSGEGTLSTPPITPATGPATPAYGGDNFTITSGSFDSPTVSFTATLGSNPDGAGGFYHGTLSFSGTQTGGTMSGTLNFTPPRTVSQTFASVAVVGITLTR